jgi:hypothetical protein
MEVSSVHMGGTVHVSCGMYSTATVHNATTASDFIIVQLVLLAER